MCCTAHKLHLACTFVIERPPQILDMCSASHGKRSQLELNRTVRGADISPSPILILRPTKRLSEAEKTERTMY